MSLYKKMLDDAIPHTPLEAEFARQIDRLNEEVLRLNKRIFPPLEEGLMYGDGGRSY